ncbi:MAG: sigma-70 family RNA polymerase sigma factor [Rhodanobacter sp.]
MPVSAPGDKPGEGLPRPLATSHQEQARLRLARADRAGVANLVVLVASPPARSIRCAGPGVACAKQQTAQQQAQHLLRCAATFLEKAHRTIPPGDCGTNGHLIDPACPKFGTNRQHISPTQRPAVARATITANVTVVDDSLNSWFAREILVHEGALMRYLLRSWFRREEIHDLRQEIYVRVYEAATKSRPAMPKSFMFTTARHLMTDRLRRGRVVSIEAVGDIDALNVLVDEITPERRLSSRQELRRLSEALDRLPDRCREVVWLRKVEDLPQKEVAARMGISEKTVEKQVAKGARLIAEHVHGGTSVSCLRTEDRQDVEDENDHGQQQGD